MIGLFLQGGMFMWPLLLLALVVITIGIKKTIEIINVDEHSYSKIQTGLNGIIFWGIIAAVVGVLGQVSGIYEALRIILNASDISPEIVLRGFAMSFITTLFGLWILVISALIWKILKIILLKKLEKLNIN